MATGFVQRWNGKIAASVIYLKGWAQSEVNAPLFSGANLNPYGVYNINASSGAPVYVLPPADPGIEVHFALTNVSSGAFVKAAAGNNFGVFGGSTITVLKSTVQMTINLIGLSSIAWAIQSIWSTSTTIIPNPTFSTTT